MRVLVYGAEGATGKRLVDQALAKGWEVRAGRRPDGPVPQQRAGLTWVTTDILERGAPAGDMDGVDAVVSAVGIAVDIGALLRPPPLHSRGTANIIEAMRQVGVKRLVTISASFVANVARGPFAFELAARFGLVSIFADMARMERMLREDCGDIEWTAVRPGWLLDAESTGDYGVFEDVIPPDLIRTRTGDLAEFMLRCVEAGSHVHATPAVARAEPQIDSGPRAVLRELAGSVSPPSPRADR